MTDLQSSIKKQGEYVTQIIHFAGNILLHPGYSFLDNALYYPEANKVLDKVFFIGAAPHYNQEVFDYIESVIKNFKND
jgi:CDP-6-deoxy-D-xylo-4-hexulose-3-dehydrase